MRGSAHSRKLSAPGGFRAKHGFAAHTEFMECVRGGCEFHSAAKPSHF